MSEHVLILLVEDDEGHARLIEKNIRRAGVSNDIPDRAMRKDLVAP